jgi:hypothetical protein
VITCSTSGLYGLVVGAIRSLAIVLRKLLKSLTIDATLEQSLLRSR